MLSLDHLILCCSLSLLPSIDSFNNASQRDKAVDDTGRGAIELGVWQHVKCVRKYELYLKKPSSCFNEVLKTEAEIS